MTGAVLWARTFPVVTPDDEGPGSLSAGLSRWALPRIDDVVIIPAPLSTLTLQTSSSPVTVSKLSLDDGAELDSPATLPDVSGTPVFIATVYELVAIYTNATTGQANVAMWYCNYATTYVKRWSAVLTTSTSSLLAAAFSQFTSGPGSNLQFVTHDAAASATLLGKYDFLSGLKESFILPSPAYSDTYGIIPLDNQNPDGTGTLFLRAKVAGGTASAAAGDASVTFVSSKGVEQWAWTQPTASFPGAVLDAYSFGRFVVVAGACAPFNPSPPACSIGGILYTLNTATGSASSTDLGVAVTVPVASDSTHQVIVALSVPSFAASTNDGADYASVVTGLTGSAVQWTLKTEGRPVNFLSFTGGPLFDLVRSRGLFFLGANATDPRAFLVMANLTYPGGGGGAGGGKAAAASAVVVGGAVGGAVALVGLVAAAVYLRGTLASGKGAEASRLLP